MIEVMRILFFKVLEFCYEIVSNLLGTVQHPYLTWKRVIREGSMGSVLLLLFLFSAYFGVRDPIRWGSLRWNGLMVERITLQKLSFWVEGSGLRFILSVLSYLLMVGLIVIVGTVMKGGKKNFWKRIVFFKVFRVWIYSYLPTVLWFAMVAGLFMILPPPRYESILGLLFSSFFLGISTGLLILKGLLYYLTLRLALNLNPRQIFWSTLIIVPVVIFYARLMYIWHIFNVPFV